MQPQLYNLLPTQLKDATIPLAFIGGFFVLRFLNRFMGGVWKHLLRPSKNLKQRYGSRNKDSWAVITGSAMGIGKQYGIELAKMGFNIVMIDKDAKEMEKTKHEISALGAKVKTITWDLGEIGNAENYGLFEKTLSQTTKDCDVCILVNNAAEFQQQSLIQMSPETLFRASNVNSHAPALLARFFLPQMLSKYDSMGIKSAIINVGTNAAEIQNPRYQFAVYGASKSYLHILSSGMQECWSGKIDILTAIPRQTKTTMCPVDFCFTATPKAHVQSILSQVGSEKQSYGTLMHDLEYQMRFKMPFGFMFDNVIQLLNKKENEKLIQLYNKRM